MIQNTIKKIIAVSVLFAFAACTTAYTAKPLPFKMPSAYPNAQDAGGAVFGVQAFTDAKEAKEYFGFDIISAGMIPVEIVIDNKGPHPIEINGTQTFLEDKQGNLWPVLNRDLAYERATKYAQTNETFKGAGYGAFLGAAAGAAIGAAIGIATGSNVGNAAGKGLAVGAAGGAVAGGASAYSADDARHKVIDDLQSKTLKTTSIEPNILAYGFIFFPAEAGTAKTLRVQIIEKDTGKTFALNFNL